MKTCTTQPSQPSLPEGSEEPERLARAHPKARPERGSPAQAYHYEKAFAFPRIETISNCQRAFRGRLAPVGVFRFRACAPRRKAGTLPEAAGRPTDFPVKNSLENHVVFGCSGRPAKALSPSRAGPRKVTQMDPGKQGMPGPRGPYGHRILPHLAAFLPPPQAGLVCGICRNRQES